jgi:hypothetical protein
MLKVRADESDFEGIRPPDVVGTAHIARPALARLWGVGILPLAEKV